MIDNKQQMLPTYAAQKLPAHMTHAQLLKKTLFLAKKLLCMPDGY